MPAEPSATGRRTVRCRRRGAAVEDLILNGTRVGLLPADRPTRPSVALLPLTQPDVLLRAHAHARRGRTAWPQLALVLDRLNG